MRWEAANAKERTQSEHRDDVKRKSSETVEAALARLTKSYSAAMTCIGALHRVASLNVDSVESIQRVADAARSTLEQAVLMDPLIAEYAPTWHHVVSQQDTSEERWAFARYSRPPPALLTSSSHRSTVRELAYLSLVNYADLLVKACPAPRDGGILDRGVVQQIPQLSWKDESIELTQRLALVALCDASELDGSDPTVWLKLACAARRVSTLSGGSQERLERHALEQGRTALPPDVPPNRLIVQALAEHQQQKNSCLVYPSKLFTPEPTPLLVLDLPRYSWSMLGRMLLRACRDGSAYRSHYYSTTTQDSQRPFGSPCIILKLSPMLVLPPAALGTICQYLDNASIWKFEATCRALSASILSARAAMERQEAVNDAVEGKKEEEKEEPSNEASMATDQVETSDEAHQGEEQATRSHRSSKRVQSQLITSGKLAERNAKRNSVEFCFLAAILGCEAKDEEYKAMLKEKIDWDAKVPGSLQIPLLSCSDSLSLKVAPKPLRGNAEVQARLGDASLTAFVNRWSAKNSGPMDVLSRYLHHIAMNVDEIFAIDQESTAVLASCIIESIDTISRRSGFHQGLDPSWYGAKPLPMKGSAQRSMEIFAINLLNAELRLRRCERSALSNNDYDDDGTIVAVLVPDLLRTAAEIEKIFPQVSENRIWISMKARVQWLAAGFYLWWSKMSRNIAESRKAESLGLEHIDEAIQCLKMPEEHPIRTVHTPHFEAPGHSDLHWRILSESSLSSFRDELQASSVVSRAREQFVERIADIEERMSLDEDGYELTDADKASFADIGSDLFVRYNVPFQGSDGKLDELMNDFLTMNGDALTETWRNNCAEGAITRHYWNNVWELVPSRLPRVEKLLAVPNQSILSILCTCMHAKVGSELALVVLLTRVVLAGFGEQGTLLQKTSAAGLKERGIENEDGFSDSEDSFGSDDMTMEVEKKVDEMKLRLNTRMIQFFLDKICDMFEKCLTREDRSNFISLPECLSLIHFSLAFSAEWYRYSVERASVLEAPLDYDLYLCTQKLVRSLLDSDADMGVKRVLQSVYFCGLARVIISQRQIFPSILRPGSDSRLGRSTRQKVCLNRAEYIQVVAGEMAYMLSKTRATIQSGRMKASHLVNALTYAAGGLQGQKQGFSILAPLSESVLWLWTYMALNDNDGATNSSAFDRPIIETLYAPVAAIIVGLCGSATINTTTMGDPLFGTLKRSDSLCLSEFYDSDASATELLLDADDEESASTTEFRQARTELLRSICHAVHCISLVSCEVNAKSSASFQLVGCDHQHGPLLPLTISRVCNHFADVLLSEFGAEDAPESKRRNLWVSEYPFGVRSTGALLDSTLYKAYRALHGFSLTGTGSQHVVVGVEHLTPPAANDDINITQNVPESTLAAAQLYRCIVRAYSNGRKSPPKAALECVASALPVMEESDRSRTIRDFLFSGDSEHFSHRDVISLVTSSADQLHSFKPVPDWVWKIEGTPSAGSDESETKDSNMEDALLVRKGICHELAQGPLPSLSGGSIDVTKTTKNDDIDAERIVTAHNEEELTKKFNAIIDDLCYGEPVNSRGWYDASQCLLMKADLIADRLGLSKGFSRANDFQIPGHRVDVGPRLRLAELIDEQEKEYERNLQGWIPYLGKDLSVFVQHQWASFPSLLSCFEEVAGSGYRVIIDSATTQESLDEDRNAFGACVWKELGVMYEKGDFVGWQQAWGGFFIRALRKIAVRCMCVGLYLLRRQDLTQSSEGFLASEISESLGITYYAELMGSQMYGYPMHIMTDHRKRKMAETARSCFQFAVDSLDASKSDEDSTECRQTWDLAFMRGKCHEKIASTYRKEAFYNQKLLAMDETMPIRAYERHMAQALKDYSLSYDEVKAIDDDRGFADIQAGGSSHGPKEVFYRLHASRLKCLLAGVSQREEERDEAECEALRLTTAHWYMAPTSYDENSNIRDKIWLVLADVVSALAQCRIDQPFFHRSVYRHAQALMWAPVFYDPVAGVTDGSLGSVPATKSYLLRGLNSTTPCAESAEAVLNPLFERKRSQLCAVWVTSGGTAPSPFGVLNNSVRKYDSLRGKYLSAHVDCLRLCKRKAKLEDLLQSTASAPRDLPSWFQASALTKGGMPESPHTKEPLLLKGRSLSSLDFLRTVKREANSALATVLLQEAAPDSEKAQEDKLKAAYGCFLRLNCTVEDVCRTRAWKFGQASIPEVDALCQSYLARKDHNDVQAEASDWTGRTKKVAILRAALQKCQELFPYLATNPYGKRKAKRASKAKVNNAPAPKETAPEAESLKRKEPDSAVPFVVSVPNGLNAGDKFDTTVVVGGTTKKIRLTVPAGNPEKLQFSLAAPATGEKADDD